MSPELINEHDNKINITLISDIKSNIFSVGIIFIKLINR